MADNPQLHANSGVISQEQEQCLKLRRDGHTIREIATMTGLPKSTVDRRIKEAIADVIQPAADDVRRLEIERMDYYIKNLTTQIERGNQVARNIEVAMKVAERRARLLGLDAPEKTDVTVHEVTQADLALQELLREAKAQNALKEAELKAAKSAGVDQ